MNGYELEEKFWLLGGFVSLVDLHGVDENIDPYVQRFVDFIKSYPEGRGLFIQLFVKICSDFTLASPYVVSSAMRFLKWDEVKLQLTELITTVQSERHRSQLRNILRSFDQP